MIRLTRLMEHGPDAVLHVRAQDLLSYFESDGCIYVHLNGNEHHALPVVERAVQIEHMLMVERLRAHGLLMAPTVSGRRRLIRWADVACVVEEQPACVLHMVDGTCIHLACTINEVLSQL